MNQCPACENEVDWLYYGTCMDCYRELLEVVETWDNVFIVVRDKTDVLCHTMERSGIVLNMPIEWRDRKKADEWVERGTVAQLQERFRDLAVSFVKDFARRKW